MLVSILYVPFADAGRQRQYEAVRAALEADADAPATVLLGNLGAFSPIQADILVVRPSGLALGVLTPQAGQLTIPALASGPWLRDGQPLPGRAGSDNPFVQYQQQLPVALAWLSEHFGLPEAELPPCAGIALFDAPLTFGPTVEAQLHRAAHDFQLIGGASQLPARLRQQSDSETVVLTEDELLDWAEYLAGGQPATTETTTEPSPINFLEQKLRRLWRWLGAEDIPADPPYGGPPPDHRLRDQQEQVRLQQLRQELQAELHQQRQEAAAREAARTQELAQLRQQLAQAGPSATEREAEQRAKVALEESLRTARAELATRNHELDARIQQLGQLIGQLQAAPAAPAAPLPKVPKSRPAAPARRFRRLRQAERWGLVALVAAGLGAGTWGIVRWVHHPAKQPVATTSKNNSEENTSEEYTSAEPDDTADSLAHMQAASIDTVTAVPTQAEPAATETSEAAVQPTPLHVDSAGLGVKFTPLLPGTAADSTAVPTSPMP